MWKVILLACMFVHCAHCVSVKCTNTDPGNIPHSIVWDEDTQSAFYVDYGVDSQKPCLFRYDTIKKHTYSAYVRGPSFGLPTFIIPIRTRRRSRLMRFAVGFDNFVAIICWDGKSRRAKLLDEIYNLRDTLGPRERLFVGHRDPTGHALYAGTLSLGYCSVPANQTVYVKRRGSERARFFGNLTSCGGYGFANGCVYLLDSCQLKIYALQDQDSKHKCVKEGVVADLSNIGSDGNNFTPIGLEADSKGILYTGNYYDGWIYCIDPITGEIHEVVQLPTSGITSLSYGNDNGNGQNLYVTVAASIRNVNTGALVSTENQKCAVYKLKDLGSGVTFKPLKV